MEYGNTSGSGEMKAEVRKSKVEEQTDCLGMALEQIDRNIAELEKRLSPVLSASVPETVATPPGLPAPCPLVGILQHRFDSACAVRDAIQSIINRLQL